jgi:glycosyltransferase involved in cell wall biosynthesis
LFETTKAEAAKSLPQNITWAMPGMVPNTEVLTFFKNKPVDCFINVSSSEGLPVSIMEATSYGIPVIATNVGGTNEIVNEQTGILLPADPSIEEIANNLISLIKSKSRNPTFRKGVYQYWNENFNAGHNYTAFCKTLKDLQ